mgnify:CR=1 FL=1
MRIAVCDDNSIELANIKKWIKNYSQIHLESDIKDIICFTSSLQMWFEIQENDIADIYILDVDIPKMNGFELAEKIRKRKSASIIIFLTAHTELAYKGYQYQAFRYVRKLNLEKELTEALDSGIAYLKEKRKVISIQHYSDCFQLLYEEIMYVNCYSHQLKIHTESFGIISEKRSLRELFKDLNDDRFQYIDRSCFVNLDFVIAIDKNGVTLKDGQKLSVSRRLFPSVKSSVIRSWTP